MQDHQTPRPTMTIGEVAAFFGLARSTAYDLAQSDRLPVPVIRAGKRVFVSRTLVERVVAGEPVRIGPEGGGLIVAAGSRGDPIALIKGELDCRTFSCHGEPAFGVPDTSNWRDDRSALNLAGIPNP